MAEYRTQRLVLRPWRDDDVPPFAAMGQDPEVMAHFPALLTYEQCAAMVGRIRGHFERHGYGLWAVELNGAFIGFCGLQRPAFRPEVVEIGWRLARAAWGHGYAIEAAQRCVRVAFDDLALSEIVAFVVPDNARSHAVCKRLGMTRDPADDFEHPIVHRHHQLYRLGAKRPEDGRDHDGGMVQPFSS